MNVPIHIPPNNLVLYAELRHYNSIDFVNYIAVLCDLIFDHYIYV